MGSKVVAALSPLVMSVRLPAALSTENSSEVMNPSTAPVTAWSTRSEMKAAVPWLLTAAAILTTPPGASGQFGGDCEGQGRGQPGAHDEGWRTRKKAARTPARRWPAPSPT